MNTKEIIKYLKTTISEKGEYCYSLSKQTTKAIVKHIEQQDKEIERLSKNNTILENKLNMIKENIETIDKKTIIEIIDNYTGFWGSDKE